jgi:tetratricopeptide (TPR) repeat protein
MYTDIERLYRQTISQNPDCAMAYTNLGVALLWRGRIDEATAHFQAALKIDPDSANAHINLATALANRGRLGEAIGHRPWEAHGRRGRWRYEPAAAVQFLYNLLTASLPYGPGLFAFISGAGRGMEANSCGRINRRAGIMAAHNTTTTAARVREAGARALQAAPRDHLRAVRSRS